MADDIDNAERRKEERQKLARALQYYVLQPGPVLSRKQKGEVETLDLSMGGLSFLGEAALSPGDHLYLRLYGEDLRNMPYPIILTGTVASVQEIGASKYRVGVACCVEQTKEMMAEILEHPMEFEKLTDTDCNITVGNCRTT
jgi:hypothetical protein